MPLNYLDLKPQIETYAQSAAELRSEIRGKLDTAMELLQECGQNHDKKRTLIHEILGSLPDKPRCALPSDEPANQSFRCEAINKTGYIILASDGSQITPGGHDAVSIALINTSRICYRPGTHQAPSVEVFTRFLLSQDGKIELGHLSDDLVALRRDVAELGVLADWQPDAELPVIAMGDGPLELFHQPRQGEDFDRYFRDYLDTLTALNTKKILLCGYTDRPRANLVVKMLELTSSDNPKADLSKLEDQSIFKKLLEPRERSAIFELRSSSSDRYAGPAVLHFFYLNVGSENEPWIARIEIPAWVASDNEGVRLVQQALLEQCGLMGTRPYPYILHRAHEEAVVSYKEKENLINQLSSQLLRKGLGVSQPSNKQSAKDLVSRRRIKK